MATGRRPFRGESAASTIASILRDDPAPVTEHNGELPREVARIIARCLQKRPDRRYQTARDLFLALDELRHEVDTGEIAGAGRSARPRRISRRTAVVAVAAAVLVASVVLLLRRDPSPPSPEPPATPQRDPVRVSVRTRDHHDPVHSPPSPDRPDPGHREAGDAWTRRASMVS
jgi:serine/threonine protein kinase